MTHDRFRTALHGRRTAISVLVVVGLLTSACTSSSSSTAPSPVTTTTPPVTGAANADGSMVDINTGEITPLPASIAKQATSYAVSPDHTTIAYSRCCTPPVPISVANVDGTQIRQVTAKGQDAYAVQWSPDGSSLVYQQRDGSADYLGNLVVQHVATGQRTRVTNFDQTQQWGWWFTFPSFAPDGRSILFQLPRGQLPDENNRAWDLWSVPVTGGKQTLVQRNAAWGGYSPDGKWLAYLSPVVNLSGKALWITSVHAGTPRTLVSNGDLSWLRWSPDGTHISYSNGEWVYVLNVATGSASRVVKGDEAEWFDDHTLILGNPSS